MTPIKRAGAPIPPAELVRLQAKYGDPFLRAEVGRIAESWEPNTEGAPVLFKRPGPARYVDEELRRGRGMRGGMR